MSDCYSPLVRLYDLVSPSMLLLAWVSRAPRDALRATLLVAPEDFSSIEEAQLFALVVQRAREHIALRRAAPSLAHVACLALELRDQRSPLAPLATRLVEVPLAAIEAAGSVEAIAAAVREHAAPAAIDAPAAPMKRLAWMVHLNDAVGRPVC